MPYCNNLRRFLKKLMFCQQCGQKTGVTAKFCLACGSACEAVPDQFPKANSFVFSEATSLLPASDGTASETDVLSQQAFYAAAVGPNHIAYYLPRFEALDRRGGVEIGWHWPAFFVTFFWLLYRRMWGMAVAYAAIPALCQIAISIAEPSFKFSKVFLGMNVLFTLACILAPAFYATPLYHKWCLKIIAEAKAVTVDEKLQLVLVRQSGGVSKIWLTIFIVFTCVFALGFTTAIVHPAYKTYQSRMKKATRVQLGIHAANQVKLVKEVAGQASGPLDHGLRRH